ncbi:hypothetical protein Z951_15460 [Streptomyces sp. PRh5]|nr:hypothetical protein Z951_15460 [Streptomyces sp. PRh5]
MLLRLAYLAATNAPAFPRLLPMSDRDKDIEILVLRHQPLVLQRQIGKPTLTDTDRAILAGLLHHLPKLVPAAASRRRTISSCWAASRARAWVRKSVSGRRLLRGRGS